MSIQKRIHWQFRALAAFVILVVGGLTLSQVDAAPASGVAKLACTTQCASGAAGVCDAGWHRAPSDTSEDAKDAGEPHSGCLEGSCSLYHFCIQADIAPATGADESALIDQLGDAIASEDVTALSEIVSSWSSVVSINTERRAIQVLSCSGDVVAHLPTTAHVVAALGALER